MAEPRSDPRRSIRSAPVPSLDLSIFPIARHAKPGTVVAAS